MFQNPDDQLFERSVEREVGFGPRHLGLPRRDGRVVSSGRPSSSVGLDAERATNPYDLDLSASEARRRWPAILAMDPARSWCSTSRRPARTAPGVARVGRIVDALQAAGESVVAITHDMEFAATHFERIVVMRDGEVVADGPPTAIFAPEPRPAGVDRPAPPPAARVAARLGMDPPALDAAGLLAALGR